MQNDISRIVFFRSNKRQWSGWVRVTPRHLFRPTDWRLWSSLLFVYSFSFNSVQRTLILIIRSVDGRHEVEEWRKYSEWVTEVYSQLGDSSFLLVGRRNTALPELFHPYSLSPRHCLPLPLIPTWPLPAKRPCGSAPYKHGFIKIYCICIFDFIHHNVTESRFFYGLRDFLCVYCHTVRDNYGTGTSRFTRFTGKIWRESMAEAVVPHNPRACFPGFIRKWLYTICLNCIWIWASQCL